MRTLARIALVAMALFVAATALADAGSSAKRMMRGRLRLPTEVENVEGPGQFDPAIFLRMISTRRAALLACYERALRGDPTLSGSVRARAVLAETGAVEEATIIESTVTAADVGSCVQRILHGFRFNPGPMGGRVSYTVTFTYAPES